MRQDTAIKLWEETERGVGEGRGDERQSLEEDRIEVVLNGHVRERW